MKKVLSLKGSTQLKAYQTKVGSKKEKKRVLSSHTSESEFLIPLSMKVRFSFLLLSMIYACPWDPSDPEVIRSCDGCKDLGLYKTGQV